MPVYNHCAVRFNNRIRSRSDNLTTSVTPPTQNVPRYFKIRLKDNNTLATVFNKADFRASAIVASADILAIYNPKTNTLILYYVRSPTLEWRSTRGADNADNAVIENNIYVGITRRGATLKTYTVNANTKITTYAPF